MGQARLNQLTSGLRAVCGEHLLREKWLLAPARRIGQQWLDAVAFSGQAVANTRVESFETFALLRLAAPEMDRQGLTFLRGLPLQVLIDRLFSRLRESGQGYLSALEPSPGLIRTLTRAISDLRLAGLTAERLAAESFEVADKGLEIRALLAAYEQELAAARLVDYAGVLRLAAERLRKGGLPKDVLILLPEDCARGLGALERELWQAVPQGQRRVLAVDRATGLGAGQAEACPTHPTDASLLTHLLDPAQAPAPRGDGTASLFRAVGEVNEVREVFQRCVEAGVALDAVEVLYADPATCLPLLYEFACRLAEEADSLPVTFAEGLPTRYSRPGRALLGWLSWVQEGFPQSTLMRLIQDGLLAVDMEDGITFARLGEVLRSLPIGAGRARYRQAIDSELKALEQKADRPPYAEDEDEPAGAAAWREQRAACLRILRDVVDGLFSIVPEGAGQQGVLDAASAFLTRFAREASELDGYARRKLLDALRELAGCLAEGDVEGLDVWEWLRDLPHEMHVGAQGPRPGCLFAAPLSVGGHSGRPYTFIIGLDDTRFPASGGQDPLLLDGERRRLSPELPTASSRLAREMDDFTDLLARLRGSVTLSYCCRSLTDARALFPSAPIWAAYRILSGNHAGDQNDLLAWLPDPVSFAPDRAERSVDLADWWLWRFCGDRTIDSPQAALAAAFPHLGRGFEARRNRESEEFTEFDGHVPEAGPDLDPARATGHVLSSSRLETLGSCPFEYFLRYALEIAPPEDYAIDPAVWLDAAERGHLLHTVFRDFMNRLYQENHQPDHARHIALMRRLLDDAIELEAKRKPPPNPDARKREEQDLHRIGAIFLREEERFCQSSHPVCFEAAIGLPADDWRTVLDTRAPVAIRLSDGSVVRARGRIDRVDEVPGSGATRFTIWDYKTGSARRYNRRDPFRQGRLLQSALYLALAQARLPEVYPNAVVISFGYFFPSLREHGERLQWTADQLAPGGEIIAQLCALLRAGCFPFTTEADDVRFSDYLAVYGDVEAAAAASQRKLENAGNAMLEPFRELRGTATA